MVYNTENGASLQKLAQQKKEAIIVDIICWKLR